MVVTSYEIMLADVKPLSRCGSGGGAGYGAASERGAGLPMPLDFGRGRRWVAGGGSGQALDASPLSCSPNAAWMLLTALPPTAAAAAAPPLPAPAPAGTTGSTLWWTRGTA